MDVSMSLVGCEPQTADDGTEVFVCVSQFVLSREEFAALRSHNFVVTLL